MKNHGLAPSDLGVEAPNLYCPVWATIRSSVELSEIDRDGGNNDKGEADEHQKHSEYQIQSSSSVIGISNPGIRPQMFNMQPLHNLKMAIGLGRCSFGDILELYVFRHSLEKVRSVIENTKLEAFSSSPLRYRPSLELLSGNINKGDVCVTGDALHPMAPDIGQGGCYAFEDSVVLARCLGDALLEMNQNSIETREEYKKIEMGLKKYAKERRRRSFDLTSTANVVGSIQKSHGKVISFLREKFSASILACFAVEEG
ncbi:hypothetical protein FNV43_RR21845 [Rhamnella rubrinervis]|uniref:FAD-binding domain-containing protein n=1 Tax=Rhamnella rubrinervis TaxID=2594499 RepID=A0A8K0DVX0_9ROSA|nr:hypothetical protein FNV43_RR21845 [Rhamnella rubrinervis]